MLWGIGVGWGERYVGRFVGGEVGRRGAIQKRVEFVFFEVKDITVIGLDLEEKRIGGEGRGSHGG